MQNLLLLMMDHSFLLLVHHYNNTIYHFGFYIVKNNVHFVYFPYDNQPHINHIMYFFHNYNNIFLNLNCLYHNLLTDHFFSDIYVPSKEIPAK